MKGWIINIWLLTQKLRFAEVSRKSLGLGAEFLLVYRTTTGEVSLPYHSPLFARTCYWVDNQTVTEIENVVSGGFLILTMLPCNCIVDEAMPCDMTIRKEGEKKLERES